MRLHPIIDEYVNTETSLLSIVDKHYDKDQYLETVFKKLMHAFNNVEIDQKLLLEIDLAVTKGHPDTDMYLLFILNVFFFTFSNNQFEKANSLYSIITSFAPEKIHPIINALCVQANSLIKKGEGKRGESKQLMRQSMTLINNKHPRYKVFLYNFSVRFAREGLLKEFSQSDIDILNSITDTRFAYLFLELKLINSILIGDHKVGCQLLVEYQEKSKMENIDKIEIFGNLLNIISDELNETKYSKEPFKVLVRLLKSLIASNREEVVLYYNLLRKNREKDFFAFDLDAYISLHAELYLGNRGMVQLMLKEKEAKGEAHYLDDLFYGRLHLMEKNFDDANKFFIRLIENVNRYGSMNRLVFELQFAKEMKLSDILLLTQGWKKDKKSTPSEKKESTNYIPKLENKGIQLLVGNSPLISQIKELVKKYSTLKAPILITGETGTGKELVSRAIHDEGLYPNEPFLAINSGALTDSLLQSELFGYEAGAFTGAQKQRKGIFEAAGKGTVFLDEFGDISPVLQVSLLRVLEANEIRMIGGTTTRKIECKVVVATNIDLHHAVVEKKFREDLFFRLARFEIKIPALKERVEDIPDLIHYFLSINAKTNGKSKSLSKELLNTLAGYHWPGNIRELKNEIDRLYILNPDHDLLDLEHFDFAHLQEAPKAIKKPLVMSTNVAPNKVVVIKEDPILELIQNGFRIEQRQMQIKELFKKYKKITRKQVVEIIKASPTTITKDLLALEASGFLVRRSPTKSTRTDYFEIV